MTWYREREGKGVARHAEDNGERTICQSVESDVVAWLVREDEERARRACRSVVAARLIGRGCVLEGDRPSGVHDEQ